MAHWAQVDENNIVVNVLVTDTNDPNGDEGYQWLVDNLGGRWIKTSYNTFEGTHLAGGVPLRGNFASLGYSYDEDLDAFLAPKPFASWIVDTEKYTWTTPIPEPDSGLWYWDEPTISWKEFEVE